MHASTCAVTIAACVNMPGCDDVAAVYCMYVPGVSITTLLRHHYNTVTAMGCSYNPLKNSSTLEWCRCRTRAVCWSVDVCMSVCVRDSHPLPSTRGIQVKVALNASVLTLHWTQVCISQFVFSCCLQYFCTSRSSFLSLSRILVVVAADREGD